jgi:hypothetical protein
MTENGFSSKVVPSTSFQLWYMQVMWMNYIALYGEDCYIIDRFLGTVLCHNWLAAGCKVHMSFVGESACWTANNFWNRVVTVCISQEALKNSLHWQIFLFTLWSYFAGIFSFSLLIADFLLVLSLGIAIINFVCETISGEKNYKDWDWMIILAKDQ